MSNLGFIDSQIAKIPNNKLPFFARNYPNTPPPSMSVGNVGFTRSPFAQDVGAVTRFLTNKVVKPVTNYTTSAINPIIDDLSEYFGYGDVSSNVIPKVPSTNISGNQIFSNIQDTGSNLINKVGGILVPSANEGEDELMKNINSGLLSNEEIVNQNKGTEKGQSLLDTNQQIINKNKEFFSGGSLTDVNNNTSSNTYDSSTSDNTTTNNQTTNNKVVDQNTNNQTVPTEKNETTQDIGVKSNDPNAEVVATANGEGTPTNKFMDKFVNFAQSEFGKDFFASLAEKSGPKVGKPQSFGSNVGSAYKEAREKQLDREKIKATKNEKNFAYIVTDTSTGKTYNAFIDKNGRTTVDIDGNFVPYRTDMFGKNTYARKSTVGNLGAGAMTKKDFYTLRGELTQSENGLQLLSQYIEGAEKSPQGYDALATRFQTYLTTVATKNKLTTEQLNQAITENRFFNLIGSNRVDILGPGVLTQADLEFIIGALGGNPSDYATNKQVLVNTLSDVLERKYRVYEDNFELYNEQAGTGVFSTNKKREKYKIPDATQEAINRNKPVDMKTTDLNEISRMSSDELEMYLSFNPTASQEILDLVNKLLDEMSN
jgi:hypothetical protein